MWKLIQDEKITVFGTSATYIHYLQKQGVKPGQDYDLSSLKQISQTGSALSAEGFEYAYREIKQDLHFNSISGGTDINGCFAAGNPISPVYAGQLQGPALAMKVKAYDEAGHALFDQQGELVCEAPAPSMPLYFWNDPENQKYRNAYFTFYPDVNVWRHGDYIVIHSDTLEEVADSVAIGQVWQGDQRIILFVKVAEGFSLTEELKSKIKKALRKDASPRHVPALMIEVPDIPYTFSMKKVESAVTNIVNGRPVLNRDALVNPESLDYYEKILPELQVADSR
jgi:acetoacetyl-CoA synthetase